MKVHNKVLTDVWMQFLVLCLLMALSVDSLKCVWVLFFFSNEIFSHRWLALN